MRELIIISNGLNIYIGFSYVCNVWPTPKPVRMAKPICLPSPDDSSRVENKPSPIALYMLRPHLLYLLFAYVPGSPSKENAFLLFVRNTCYSLLKIPTL